MAKYGTLGNFKDASRSSVKRFVNSMNATFPVDKITGLIIAFPTVAMPLFTHGLNHGTSGLLAPAAVGVALSACNAHSIYRVGKPGRYKQNEFSQALLESQSTSASSSIERMRRFMPGDFDQISDADWLVLTTTPYSDSSLCQEIVKTQLTADRIARLEQTTVVKLLAHSKDHDFRVWFPQRLATIKRPARQVRK